MWSSADAALPVVESGLCSLSVAPVSLVSPSVLLYKQSFLNSSAVPSVLSFSTTTSLASANCEALLRMCAMVRCLDGHTA